MSSPEPATTDPAPKKSHSWALILALGCLLAVVGLVLLGLLATFVVPNMLDRFDVAQRKKAEIDVMAIDLALSDYALNNGGAYPTTLEVLVTPDANGQTYLSDFAVVPLDPWANPYHYVPGGNGAQPRVVSFGKDGRPGGNGDDADITNLPSQPAAISPATEQER